MVFLFILSEQITIFFLKCAHPVLQHLRRHTENCPTTS